MRKISFQYYPAKINTTKPLGSLTVPEFIAAIKNPSDNIKETFKLIAQAEAAGDMETKATLKQENLFYFTPCVFSNGKSRGYKDIDNFTGLAVMDFDHIEHATEFRDYMFKTYKFIAIAFLSASKRGIKVLVKIPVVKSVDEYKSFFYGLGVMFDKYKGWDGTPQNAVLPLFLSYDPDILFREDPETFVNKGTKLNAFKENNNTTFIKVDPTTEDSKRVYYNIETAFNNITDNGHPQVIAACISLGGYVGAGYLNQTEAEDWAANLISNNSYLKKGVSGYIKTSKTAILNGMRQPLKLKEC